MARTGRYERMYQAKLALIREEIAVLKAVETFIGLYGMGRDMTELQWMAAVNQVADITNVCRVALVDKLHEV